MEQSRANIMPLSSFIDYDVMDDRHSSSLLAPYEGTFADGALWEWLGLAYGYEQISDDLIPLRDLDTSVSKMDINDDTEEKQTIDQEEKIDDKKEDNNEKEINEEEEEEQRRRDEIDIEDEYFIPSAVTKPATTVSNSTNEQVLSKDDNDDDDGQEKWKVVQKKPYDRRRLIRHILQYPTTLTDQTVQQINDDAWQLPTAQRHDLYRYWLLKYQQYLHNSVRDARRDYNQAVSALTEYHQDEDYYILKDSIIVAMTTTCAAKYHTVLERLRKKRFSISKNIYLSIYF